MRLLKYVRKGRLYACMDFYEVIGAHLIRLYLLIIFSTEVISVGQ